MIIDEFKINILNIDVKSNKLTVILAWWPLQYLPKLTGRDSPFINLFISLYISFIYNGQSFKLHFRYRYIVYC